MTRKLKPAAVLASLGVLLLAACGGDESNAERFEGEEREVAAVVDELTDASRDGDGERICEELLTENLAISIRRASGQECGEEVIDNIGGENTEFRAERISVAGTSAQGRIVDEDGRRTRLLFEKVGGEGWRIARIG